MDTAVFASTMANDTLEILFLFIKAVAVSGHVQSDGSPHHQNKSKSTLTKNCALTSIAFIILSV